MDAIKALKLLIDVPEDEWCRFTYLDITTKTCCAVGHLVRIDNSYTYDDLNNQLGISMQLSGEMESFLADTRNAYEKIHDKPLCIMSVNDKPTEEYRQKTSKQRVIAFLIDMIKYENRDADEILKSILNSENNEKIVHDVKSIAVCDSAKHLLHEIQGAAYN